MIARYVRSEILATSPLVVVEAKLRSTAGAELEGGDIVVAWLVQPFVTTHPASIALRKRRGPSSGCPT